MCYGAEAAWVPALMEAVAAVGEGAAATASTAGTALATGAGAVTADAAAITAAEVAAALAEGGLLASEAVVAPAAIEGGGLLANTAYNAMLPGVGQQQAAALAAQTGEFGAAGLGKTMEAAAGAQGLNSLQASAAKIGGGLLGAGGGGVGTEGLMAAKMGLDMMSPKQAPPGPQAPPMQAQQGPLANPYGQGGNSLGIQNMSEAEKRRLRALGYQV